MCEAFLISLAALVVLDLIMLGTEGVMVLGLIHDTFSGRQLLTL